MSKFQELLAMARYQAEPVKLLMLFTKSSIETASKEVNKGYIQPVMCVDKLPEELSDFASLSKEADVINPDWDLIFITSISANVDSSIIDQSMKSIVTDVQTGKNTSMYVVLDREDNIVEMVGS